MGEACRSNLLYSGCFRSSEVSESHSLRFTLTLAFTGSKTGGQCGNPSIRCSWESFTTRDDGSLLSQPLPSLPLLRAVHTAYRDVAATLGTLINSRGRPKGDA
jgi:hypothetical protein